MEDSNVLRERILSLNAIHTHTYRHAYMNLSLTTFQLTIFDTNDVLHFKLPILVLFP